MSERPAYSWEYEVPNTKFWNSLDYKVGRNFLQCFTEDEISQFQSKLDPALATTQKLQLLQSLLHAHQVAKETAASPQSLCDVNYNEWQTLMTGIATIESELGDDDEQERILLDMMNKGPNGGRNLSAVYQLAGINVDKGRYVEAEEMSREVIPWLQQHPSAGKDSPQAFGATRTLIRAIAGQGRRAEAQEVLDQAFSLIQGMDGGNFAMYKEEEQSTLEELEVELRLRE